MLVEHLNKERIQKFKETGDLQYIYQNEIDKIWFKRDMAYEDFKDLTWKTTKTWIIYFILLKIWNICFNCLWISW